MLPLDRRARTPHPAGSAAREGMRASTLEGLFSTQYVTLTSGSLLTAFLVTLGAGPGAIGFVAALPLLGQLLQPLGAEAVRRRGGRRRALVAAGAGAEALLFGAALGAVAVWGPRALPVVLVLLAAQQIPTAMVAVGWTSWISDLVPPRLRGRYFGRRNLVANSAAAVTALVAGQVVGAAGEHTLTAFVAAMAVGVAARGVAAALLARQPEPVPAQSVGGGFLGPLAGALRDPDFRRYLAFSAAWAFAIHVVSPFFTVYMLEEARVGTGLVMTMAAISTGANLVGQRVWGPLADRYGERATLRASALVVVLQPLWWLFAGPSLAGQAVMIGVSLTGGFAWGGHLLATGNLMMRLAPAAGKTQFFAAQAALAGAAGALGPLVGGGVAEALRGGALAGVPLSLKWLFGAAVVLRLGAWALLSRVPEPVPRAHRLRVAVILRDTARTFNPTQGFSPLFHTFARIPSPFDGRERGRRAQAARDRQAREARAPGE